MDVINLKLLDEFRKQHADGRNPIQAWYEHVTRVIWNKPEDVRNDYPKVSIVGNDRAVFNIKGNAYRLVVQIDYTNHIVFIRFIGTHSEYNKVDASTI